MRGRVSRQSMPALASREKETHRKRKVHTSNLLLLMGEDGNAIISRDQEGSPSSLQKKERRKFWKRIFHIRKKEKRNVPFSHGMGGDSLSLRGEKRCPSISFEQGEAGRENGWPRNAERKKSVAYSEKQANKRETRCERENLCRLGIAGDFWRKDTASTSTQDRKKERGGLSIRRRRKRTQKISQSFYGGEANDLSARQQRIFREKGAGLATGLIILTEREPLSRRWKGLQHLLKEKR